MNRRDASHYLLDAAGEFDRSAIARRAIYERRRAAERGDDETDLAFWTRFVWRCARGQKEAAQWSRLEARARAIAGGR